MLKHPEFAYVHTFPVRSESGENGADIAVDLSIRYKPAAKSAPFVFPPRLSNVVDQLQPCNM